MLSKLPWLQPPRHVGDDQNAEDDDHNGEVDAHNGDDDHNAEAEDEAMVIM